MTQISLFEKELENEAVTTRKMLALVPAEKFDWKPHPKSMVMMNLATHIAELPTWIGMVLNTDELDFAANEYKPTIVKDNAGLMELFEKSLADGRTQLANGKEDSLEKIWILRTGEQILSSGSKADMIRISLSQIIHHRAQLGVYLRLLDIPIPGSYGPSADDNNF
ncbi:MAG: DinB family protein [Ferruginibacter sp.]